MLEFQTDVGPAEVDPDAIAAIETHGKDYTRLHLAGGSSIVVKGDLAAVKAIMNPPPKNQSKAA